MTKLNFFLILFLSCCSILKTEAFQIIVPNSKCDYTEWYEEPNCNNCVASVELIEFKGKLFVAFWADNKTCSDAQTLIYNCDGTVFCKEGGIQGLTECSDAQVLIKSKPNYTVIQTIWSNATDCEPKCCVSYKEFVKRTEAPMLTNAPDLSDCTLHFATTALTACDQVMVDLGGPPMQGPFNGNFNLSHTYATPGTYEVCLYFTEIDENGKPCWEAANCFEVNANCEPDCVSQCNASHSLNVSTGIDAFGVKLECSINDIDPFWKLINKPPIQQTCPGSALISTIDGSAYVVNHDNNDPDNWANQSGVGTIAPVKGGCDTNFGCNNLTNVNNNELPYIFERTFCICEDDSVNFDLNVKADDILSLELWDISSSTMLSFNPGNFNFQTGPHNWNFDIFLPIGTYALRANLSNTNATVLGFSIVGNVTSLSNTETIIQDTLCCENNTVNVRKILDQDCNGQVDATDQVGSGWEFELRDIAGNLIQTGTTNINGELFFNDVLAGSYTITEMIQPGWFYGTPSNGTSNITVSPGGFNVVEFFNCPDICCVDEQAFIDRTENILTNAPDLEDCTLAITTVELTECDQVAVDWGDGLTDGPFTGNINLTHTYATTGTYNVCLYFAEIDESGKTCWKNENCFKVNANCIPNCPLECNPTNSLNISTGIDELGNQLSCNTGTIDPFWRLINNPLIEPCNNTLVNTINGNAYAMDFTSGWANQPGVRTIAPIDGDCSTIFGCNNLTNSDNEYLPYIFERTFCICEDDSVNFDLNVSADDILSLELWDISSSTVLTSNPGNFNFQTGPHNWNFDTFLPVGTYALRANLANTNSVVLGFSIAGNVTSLSNTQSIIQDTLCCENNTINVRKILDNDCNGQVDATDQVGSGWEFELRDVAGNLIQTGTTNNNGELFFNDVLAGTYTITEVLQPGWMFGTPSSGTTNITVTPGGFNVVEFFNCPVIVETCCDDYEAFLDRIITPIITNGPDLPNCELDIETTALTECDQVSVNWGDGSSDGPIMGNVSLNHIYEDAGTYTVCMYFSEIDEDGKVCWKEKICFEVNANCDCCDEIANLEERVSYLEELLLNLNEKYKELSKNITKTGVTETMHIYPNPNKGNLFAKYVIKETSNNAKLVITSAEGIEVSTTKISCTGNCRSDLILPNNLSSGIYYCTLYVNDTLIESVPFVYQQ